MSDWNRGREDDQRRDRDEVRRGWGARNREPGYDQGKRERRSFDDRNEEYGGDWREGQRSRYQGAQNYGEQGSQRYGQGYGQASGSDQRSQSYGGSGPYYGEGGYGSRGYGQQRYGAQGYAGQGGQTYGGREAYGDPGQRWGDRNQSEFGRTNEPLQRVTQGEADQGLWSNLGRGEHRGRGPKNYTRSDDRIREDVNDRLSDDDWLDATEIEVQVSSCEVTLTGSVDSREDRRRAEDLAEQVSGVKHVQNNLRVNQSTTQAGANTATTGSTQAPGQTRGTGSQLS